MRTIVALLCLTFVCVAAPAEDAPATPANAPAASPEAAIKQGAKDFDATWATHDAHAIAAHYAADAELVTADGNTFAGREGIEQALSDGFNGPLKDSTLTTTVEKIRLIKPDVAIVDSEAQLRTTDGDPKKLHILSVLVHKDGKWITETTRAIAYQQQ